MAPSSRVVYLYSRIRDKEVAIEGKFGLGSISDGVESTAG
jgi:hypothetical protein